MGIFYYGPSSKNNKWYFRLRDSNNEIILASTEGYETKQGCLVGIESVKQHSPYDSYYKRFSGSDGKSYFTLHASNGEAIGKSEGYNSNVGRENGITNCKVEAPRSTLTQIASF